MTTAFVEPGIERKQHVISQMHRVSSLPEDQREEFEEVVRQLRMDIDTGIRSRTSSIPDSRDNGQHHYFAIRALNDPRTQPIGTDGAQLCGEEYFGVNRFIDELLDVADVQWWGLYEGRGWSLHERCKEGEHLECWGSWGNLRAAVVMVNGIPLSVDETLSFYRTLKNRGRKGFTQRFKREDIQKSLERIVDGKRVSSKELQILKSLRLYDGTELTYTGRAFLEQQEAKERKETENYLQVALDHHGLTADRKLGPHGNLFEIAHYLEQTGIKALLDKPTLTETEYRELKSKEAEFVKKYGFSFLQESLIKLYTLDDIQNHFIKILAADVLPAVIKGADLENTVIEAYKQKHQSDFKYRIRDAVMSSIASSSYDTLEACVNSIEQAAENYDIGKRNILTHLKLSLRDRAQKEFSSNSLQDKYSLIAMIEKFPKFLTFKKSEQEQLARDTFDLFKKEYKKLQQDKKSKAVSEFLTKTESLGLISLDNVVDFIFQDVSDPDSLKSTIEMLDSVDNSRIKTTYLVCTNDYLKSLIKGKTLVEKLDICLQYQDIFSHTNIPLPQEIAKLGDLKDLQFIASLCQTQKDKLADYDKFAYDVDLTALPGKGIAREVLFVELFGEIDDDTLNKLSSHFRLEGDYDIEKTKSGLKITIKDIGSYKGSYSLYNNIKPDGKVKEFAQAALFCSYAAALDKDPNTQFDPKKKYAFVVDARGLKFKFGSAVLQGKSPYDIDTIEEIPSKKSSSKKYGDLESILSGLIERNDDDLLENKKINYLKNDYKIINKSFNEYISYKNSFKF